MQQNIAALKKKQKRSKKKEEIKKKGAFLYNRTVTTNIKYFILLELNYRTRTFLINTL